MTRHFMSPRMKAAFPSAALRARASMTSSLRELAEASDCVPGKVLAVMPTRMFRRVFMSGCSQDGRQDAPRLPAQPAGPRRMLSSRGSSSDTIARTCCTKLI
jgi:hypothetical protein